MKVGNVRRYPGRVYTAFLGLEAVAADTWYILVDKSNPGGLYTHPDSTSHFNLLTLDLESEKATSGVYDIWVGVVYENDATDGSIGLIHVYHLEADGNPTDSTDRFSKSLDFTCNGTNPQGLDLSIQSERLGSDLTTDGEFENWTGGELDSWTESHANIDAAEDESGVSGSAAQLTDSSGLHYIYQAITVTAGSLYKLAFDYKNTAGDVAQYALYDATNSANITTATDLTNSTSWAGQTSVYFVAPDACTSVQVRLGCKAAGDIVWFDQCTLKRVITINAPVYLRGTYLVNQTALQSDAKNLYTAMGTNWANGGDQFSAGTGDIVVFVEEVSGSGTIDVALTAQYTAT